MKTLLIALALAAPAAAQASDLDQWWLYYSKKEHQLFTGPFDSYTDCKAIEANLSSDSVSYGCKLESEGIKTAKEWANEIESDSMEASPTEYVELLDELISDLKSRRDAAHAGAGD